MKGKETNSGDVQVLEIVAVLPPTRCKGAGPQKIQPTVRDGH